jgi:hypothetical protein
VVYSLAFERFGYNKVVKWGEYGFLLAVKLLYVCGWVGEFYCIVTSKLYELTEFFLDSFWFAFWVIVM